MLITPLVGRAKASSMEIDDQKGAKKKHATPDAVQFRHSGQPRWEPRCKGAGAIDSRTKPLPGKRHAGISALLPVENNEPPESHEFNGQILERRRAATGAVER